MTRELRRQQGASDPLEAAAANRLIRRALSGELTLSPFQLDQVRQSMPRLDDHLWAWIYAFTGVKIPRRAVCEGHSAPLRMFADQVLTRPPITLWVGPRGGGKSFLSALDTHVTSRMNPRHGTRILGGSKAQSAQIYEAIRDTVQHGSGPLGSDAESIAELLKTEATYVNGSNVSILAASSTSVRGPHVPSLKLDEVDEISDDLRQSAVGMAMDIRGQRSSILMTSTWHRVAGPMAGLIEQGRRGDFPVHTFCAFEILERCPDERSGAQLERCPDCALVAWCHGDRPASMGPAGEAGIGAEGVRGVQAWRPKAKRSDGHYSIDTLIQKVRAVSPRVFVSDYLCGPPIASNVWFTRFDETANVSYEAEYDPTLPIHVSTDCGVWTGAVFMQVRRFPNGGRLVTVFGEHLSEDAGAEGAAIAILDGLARLVGPEAMARSDRSNRLIGVRTTFDSAGSARTATGKTVFAEYEAVGLIGNAGMETWEKYPGSVADTLEHLDALVCSADGTRSLKIHPRCRRTIAAFQGYERKVVANQVTDEPKDPQHPHEEMIDALRGGLSVEFPSRKVEPEPRYKVSPRRVF